MTTTIFALSSGRGPAGVAVVRMSGPAVPAILDAMAPPVPKARMAALRRIRHPRSVETIDEALVLYFPAPRSETGEEMAEFQLHGSRAVVAAVLDALRQMPGCRLAEPGEFARRAFENGKIDLTAAEGLADLVAAETEGQRRQALQQAGGALARQYAGWRERAIEALALAEAAIDFSDESDVGAGAHHSATEIVGGLLRQIEAHLSDGRRGEILRDGFQVVLAGPPNAGKSSLLNALAARDVAIVSDEPGTTRDVIEVKLDLGGYPVVIADTAGLREAHGIVEREGIRRTHERALAADMVVWLIDGADPRPPEWPAGQRPGRAMVVASKADLRPPGAAVAGAELAVSAQTGEGLPALVACIMGAAAAAMPPDEAPALTQARHRHRLEECRDALRRFLAGPAGQPELRAEDLRVAAQAIGRVTGAVDVEDVLDQVFGRFCIGK